MATYHPQHAPDSPIDKWEVQLRKGCLELAILGCLWPGKLYGMEMMCRLEGDGDLVLCAVMVYALLASLKAEGLLKSECVEADSGHPRKYYQLTPKGRSRAVDTARMWARFSANLKGLLTPVLKEGGK
jgi:PadR family transcriptional regulator PadR